MRKFKLVNGTEMTVNEKYSHKDFTNQTFTDIDPDEFSNTIIVNSCFYQTRDGHKGNRPRFNVFPAGIQNCRFVCCNLDNVVITGGMDISDDGFNRNCSNEIDEEQ